MLSAYLRVMIQFLLLYASLKSQWLLTENWPLEDKLRLEVDMVGVGLDMVERDFENTLAVLAVQKGRVAVVVG